MAGGREDRVSIKIVDKLCRYVQKRDVLEVGVLGTKISRRLGSNIVWSCLRDASPIPINKDEVLVTFTVGANRHINRPSTSNESKVI